MKQTSSRQAVTGRALQRTSGSQEGTEKQEGCLVLKMGSEHPEVCCAARRGLICPGGRGYWGTIRTPSSKVG